MNNKKSETDRRDKALSAMLRYDHGLELVAISVLLARGVVFGCETQMDLLGKRNINRCLHLIEWANMHEIRIWVKADGACQWG